MKYLIPLSFLICISFHINALESKPDQWKQVPNFLLSYKNIQEAMCPFPELFNIFFLAKRKSLNAPTETLIIACIIVAVI